MSERHIENNSGCCLSKSRPEDLIADISAALNKAGYHLSIAESCTGGLLGNFLTDMPGSSKWFAGGAIVYSNHLKTSLLNVDENTLWEKGAVSRECVLEMVEGVATLCATDVGIAVSGIAGPGGGSEDKPVGTVFIAWKLNSDKWAKRFLFSGNRKDIKHTSVLHALAVLRDAMK
ncbi:MAG: CinA family protein [Thermodesulfobacteriota bacterium]